MPTYTRIKTSEYHDSITLMLVAKALLELPGVEDAAVVMGTPANREIVAAAGLLAREAETARPDDLLIAIRAADEAAGQAALHRADELLAERAPKATATAQRPKSLASAIAAAPDANLAVISVAGRYAAREARTALERGLHVLVFSDNVPLEEEISLKRLAVERGLLCMGPDAGTAIINGVALGFANAVPRGRVGLVSASGTGLQGVTCGLAQAGAGVSQAIGTGGRDLSEPVGGLMMLAGLRALQEDPDTGVIVLISKPPAAAVADRILAQLKRSDCAGRSPDRASGEPECSGRSPDRASGEPECSGRSPDRASGEPECSGRSPDRASGEPECSGRSPDRASGEPECSGRSPDRASGGTVPKGWFPISDRPQQPTHKPIVVCFLGADPLPIEAACGWHVTNLTQAAAAAAALARGEKPDAALAQLETESLALIPLAAAEQKKLQPGQVALRGLFAGGTFCYEAQLVLKNLPEPIYSNAPLDKTRALRIVGAGSPHPRHTCIDLGEDEYTQGRLHPMIDPSLRNRRIVQEAHDPAVAVILLDMVLGYGAHPDPAGATVEAIRQAQRIAGEAGRYIAFIASVCGTEADPQPRSQQEAKLRAAGAIVLPDNASAARLAGLITQALHA